MIFNKLKSYRSDVQHDSMRSSAAPVPTDTGEVYL